MASTSFSNFPDAVLAAIFTILCGNEPVLLPRRRMDIRGILSRVDERWRLVLHSTSTLWDNILFTSPPSTPLMADDLLAEFYTCTARSGNNLLAIAFDMGPYDWRFSILHCVVLPNVGRIRKLTCPIHTNNDISTFFEMPEGQFSALESLEIAFVHTWDEPISWFPLDDCLKFNVLRTVPHLRKVKAHLFNGLHPVDLHLPWDQLTSIDLASVPMTPEVFVKIIRYGTRRLEDGYFQVRFIRVPLPQQVLSRTAITMDSLKTLRLRLIYPSNDIRLFSTLRFPVLRTLSIEMFDRRQHWDVSIYINLIRASKYTLQQLHLSDFQPPGLRIFRTAQNVQGHPPINRQYRHTTHQALEELFNIITNVESLTLPLGLPLHVFTVEKLTKCDLLPRLRMLEVGATIDSAHHFLSVLKRRHDFILHGAASSVVVPHPPVEPRPSIICVLDLWIPHYQYTTNTVPALNQQTRVLASLGIVVNIHPTNDLPLPIK